MMETQPVIIAATFTAQPVNSPLTFWQHELDLPVRFEHAPYNQVFQQLLDPAGLLNSNPNGVNVLLIRLEDWAAGFDQEQPAGKVIQTINRNVTDLARHLQATAARSSAQFLVFLCPPSSRFTAFIHPDHLMAWEQQLHTACSSASQIHFIPPAEVLHYYPVAEIDDPYGEQQAHIPYSPLYFTALGTMIARKIAALHRAPKKVIVLDCDQTLWQGVCGEDGPAGIQLTPAHQALQQFMVRRHGAGFLLCLCSKNHPADVQQVFAHRPEIPLQEAHIIAQRLNWQAKSENLISLAAELDLSLDSFIFIDDNPLECAEVRAHCPQVLTLLLPPEIAEIPRFLDHVWPFDRLQVTAEDRTRTALYRQAGERRKFQEAAPDMAAFIAGLELEVQIEPLQEHHLPRAAQLTGRTNQFNLTTIRRSEPELQALLHKGDLTGRVVSVRDRFGDYGLVGLLLFRYGPKSLAVDTLLLSCRALGRGVEHHMLAHLGQLALEQEVMQVCLPFVPTPRNRPAHDFLESLSGTSKEPAGETTYYFLPAATAAQVIYQPQSSSPAGSTFTQTSNELIAHTHDQSRAELWERVATELNDARQILAAIETQNVRHRPAHLGKCVPPRTDLEIMLAQTWAQVLNLETVGIDDDFFALGGDSLKGAMCINQIQAQLETYIYITALFEAPTIARFAAYLQTHYPDSLEKRSLAPSTPGSRHEFYAHETGDRLEKFRSIFQRSPSGRFTPHSQSADPNPPAVFILSPPRSGSTLLRVMLAGHPLLFTPPELDLLTFETLRERKEMLAGRDQFRLTGAIRALMALHRCDATAARQMMADYETAGLTVKQFYRLLQSWCAPRLLVDKSVYYALDQQTLQRAEADFENPFYIHLSRHPLGAIHSFVDVRMDRVIWAENHGLSVAETAELTWLTGHQNILAFLQDVPPERQHHLTFEHLVARPETVMAGVCRFLGLEYHPSLLQPYQDRQQRMTDGLHGQADPQMRGDPKFHQHQAIDPAVADHWQSQATYFSLQDTTWEMAASLGYAPPSIELAIPQEAPLSFAQQRLWTLQQIEGPNPAYNVPLALQITGRLEIPALERAVHRLVRRHAILRTTFHDRDGVPYQQIAEARPVPISTVDLQSVPSSRREAELQQRVQEEARQLFDSESGSLFRITIFQLEAEKHLLLLVIHHIIFDRWSIGVFLPELLALYQAERQGERAALPPLPLQYIQVAQKQREQWAQSPPAGLPAYWKEQLRHLPPALDLPADFPRPAVQTYRGAQFLFALPAPLTSGLKAVSQQGRATLFMTLLAAFTTLLYRYSGQEDIVVGSLVANRNQADLEKLIGFFVNTLVLRTNHAGNPTFQELLARIRNVCLEAFAHQDMPFEQLVAALKPPRDLGRTPLFQVLFVLQNTPDFPRQHEELSLEWLPIDTGTAKFDLSVYCTETAGGLSGIVEYSIDLFAPETIARLVGHWQTLLAAIVQDPAQRIAYLPLLTRPERETLLRTWNHTRRDDPESGLHTIHELFAAQAARTPDAVALIEQDRPVTYRELNRQANQLAHYLQSQGVQVGDYVGICLHRSATMVLGLLGILKAGAAFVPLDPTYPRERLNFMLADAAPRLLLTQEDLAGIFDPPPPIPLVCLDRDWAAITGRSQDTNPESQIDALGAAYLIYTSGSTGKPKGVVGLHRGAVNRFRWMWSAYPFTPDEVCCQKTALSFVDAIWEIFGPLLRGIPAVIIPDEIVQDLPRLLDTLVEHRVTRMVLVPGLLQAILESDQESLRRLSALKLWTSSGEALPLDCARRFQQQFPQATLLNLYGSSEVAADVTCYEIGQLDTLDAVPIGRPVDNTQIYILDACMQPVPPGVSGELYVGGAGLARAYHHRPALTAERFTPNPFASDENDTRLFKTGDSAAYRPSGLIIYLGRRDHQVKVRGFRIELGEIETQLRAHPGVQQAVVTAQDSSRAENRLAAYVVPTSTAPAVSDLRRHLQTTLPPYMIPAQFVFLEALPLTPSGKVDRPALPPAGTAASPPAGSSAPKDELERQLAHLWQEILDRDSIGVDDDFFELGGHSLLAMRLLPRMERLTGQKLSPAMLFHAPTISQMAVVLRREGWSPAWISLAPIQPHGFKPPLFCVGPYNGNILGFIPLANHLGRERPLYGLQPPGLDGRTAALTRIEEVAAHYIGEIRLLQPDGPYHLAGHCFGAKVVLEMAHQLQEQEQAVALLAMIDPVWFRRRDRRGRINHRLRMISYYLRQGRLAGRIGARVRQRFLLSKVGRAVSDPQAQRERAIVLANVEAMRHYEPRPYSGRIVYFQSEERAKHESALGTSRWFKLGEAAGLGDWDIQVVPGSNHLNILQEPYVNTLAEKLQQSLGDLT